MMEFLAIVPLIDDIVWFGEQVLYFTFYKHLPDCLKNSLFVLIYS